MWYSFAVDVAPYVIAFITVMVVYRKTSRLYRKTIQYDTLIMQRRSLWNPWRWVFDRSEEDPLVRMENELFGCREKSKRLTYLIPREKARLKKEKDLLIKYMVDHGTQGGQVVRDVWRPRKEPVRLIHDYSLERKKKDDSKGKAPKRPAVIAELSVPDRK
jgi:hypothetical protein